MKEKKRIQSSDVKLEYKHKKGKFVVRAKIGKHATGWKVPLAKLREIKWSTPSNAVDDSKLSYVLEQQFQAMRNTFLLFKSNLLFKTRASFHTKINAFQGEIKASFEREQKA